MQLQLDWARRDRCAQRIDQSLTDIGICASQRAVAILVFTHEQATMLEHARQIMRLRISYRRAAVWLNRNSDLYRNFDLHHSALHQAVIAWTERGVMFSQDTRPATLLLNGIALREWHAARICDPSEFASRWENVERRSAMSSDVEQCRGVSHHSERVSERESLSQREQSHSLTHSVGGAAPPVAGALPDLPLEVWDPQCSEKRLCDVLRGWWVAEGLRDRGHDPDAVLGAILAARHNRATSPQSYVARCLQLGVKSGWRQRAAALRKRSRSPAAVAAPADRSKPPRIIGPGTVRAAHLAQSCGTDAD